MYQVSIFFSSDNNSGADSETGGANEVYIQKNNINLKESHVYSNVFSQKSTSDDDSAGKMFMIQLKKGQAISAAATSLTQSIHYISFCVYKLF